MSAEEALYWVPLVRAPLASFFMEPASTMMESSTWMLPSSLYSAVRRTGKTSTP